MDKLHGGGSGEANTTKGPRLYRETVGNAPAFSSRSHLLGHDGGYRGRAVREALESLGDSTCTSQLHCWEANAPLGPRFPRPPTGGSEGCWLPPPSPRNSLSHEIVFETLFEILFKKFDMEILKFICKNK